MGRALRRLGARTAAWTAVAIAIGAAPATARAEGRGTIDLGARAGYALPVGALDRGTHALDTSFGGLPFALDAVVRVSPPQRWAVFVGVLGAVAPTVPAQCATVSSCLGSIGRDFELDWLTRVRGPRVRFFVPEAELGFGWSWSSRSLEDGDARSTRRWMGPVFVRAAFVPAFPLGETTRLGVVLGGSVGATASSRLVAPGIDQRGLRGGLHGTLDVGVRFAVDLGAKEQAMERRVLGQ